jgi:hypothetical protein
MSAPAVSRWAAEAQTSAAWTAAWADALTALELEVDRAEALLVMGALPAAAPVPAAAWVAPDLAGPLPQALRSRAEAIVARQQQVAADLARAIALARRELTVAERMDWRVDRRTPAFLDADF